jgi:hypothetical protein
LIDEAGVIPAENLFAPAVPAGVDIQLALQRRWQLGRFQGNDNLIERIEDPRGMGMNHGY